MRIAVTGANGHVGVNLCQTLLDQGHQVNALVHRHHEALDALSVNLIHGDVLDKKSLIPLMDGVDVVFHLAARISIDGDPEGMVWRINVDGTRNMLDVAGSLKIRRFIHFSSIHAILAGAPDQVLNEKYPLVGNNGHAYDRSKAAGEREVLNASKNGLDALVLSPTAIIGPEDPEPSLTGRAVIDLCRGRIPALVPGGYDWVDVRDVVTSAIQSIEHGRRGEKYLLSGKWVSLKDFSGILSQVCQRPTISTVLPLWIAKTGLPFIRLYSKLSGTEPLYTSESLKIIHEGNRRISHEKAALDLGHHPRLLENTLTDLVEWLKATRQL